MAEDTKAEANENKTERVQLLMSPSEVEAIDDWGFSHRIRTRAEAIRRLASQGLHYDSLQTVAAEAMDIVGIFASGETPSEDRLTSFIEKIKTDMSLRENTHFNYGVYKLQDIIHRLSHGSEAPYRAIDDTENDAELFRLLSGLAKDQGLSVEGAYEKLMKVVDRMGGRRPSEAALILKEIESEENKNIQSKELKTSKDK